MRRGRLLALARAPAASPATRSCRPPGCSCPGGVDRRRRPQQRQPAGRAFGDDWLHLDLPRHLVHLTADALTPGLEARGFEVERTSRTRGGQVVIGWLDGLVGALPGRPDLYQSLRRTEARRRSQSPRASGRSRSPPACSAPGRGARARRSRSSCDAEEPSTLRHGCLRQTQRRPARLTQRPRDPKVIVVMPARQAAATLERTVAEIPHDEVDEIILVDDSSTDETVELARELPLDGHLAPASGRLRRQPEDLLPRGPPAGRRRRRDAPPRRPVRAGPDPEHGRTRSSTARPTSSSARAWRCPAGRSKPACRAGSSSPTAS